MSQLSNFSSFDDTICSIPNENPEDLDKFKPFSTNIDSLVKDISDFEKLDLLDSIYFRKIENETKENTKLEIPKPPKKNPLFKTTLEILPTKENEINNNILGKKRGRKPLKGIQQKKNNVKKKPPRKYDSDNIIIKNQAHYMNFIPEYNNCILKGFGIKRKFKKIDYFFKKNPKFENFEELKGKTLGDILQLRISGKYKKTNKNHNKNLYDEIKDLPVIKNILKENYMIFFKEVYYKSERKINLKKYGSDKILTLSEDIKTFQDKVNSFKDQKYAEIYKTIINQIYINNNGSFLNPI